MFGYFLHAATILTTIILYITAYVKYNDEKIVKCIVFGISATILLFLDILIIPECRKIENFLRQFIVFVLKSRSQDVYLYIDWKLHPKKYRINKGVDAGYKSKDKSQKTENENKQCKENAFENARDEDIADLFAGTSTLEEVKSRYHSLIKLYHPDNQNGNTEMATIIQKQYERKCKEL